MTPLLIEATSQMPPDKALSILIKAINTANSSGAGLVDHTAKVAKEIEPNASSNRLFKAMKSATTYPKLNFAHVLVRTSKKMKQPEKNIEKSVAILFEEMATIAKEISRINRTIGDAYRAQFKTESQRYKLKVLSKGLVDIAKSQEPARGRQILLQALDQPGRSSKVDIALVKMLSNLKSGESIPILFDAMKKGYQSVFAKELIRVTKQNAKNPKQAKRRIEVLRKAMKIAAADEVRKDLQEAIGESAKQLNSQKSLTLQLMPFVSGGNVTPESVRLKPGFLRFGKNGQDKKASLKNIRSMTTGELVSEMHNVQNHANQVPIIHINSITIGELVSELHNARVLAGGLESKVASRIIDAMSQINNHDLRKLLTDRLSEVIEDAKIHSKQDLVNLLKNPLCRHQARRAILDELGQRTGQQFANVWGFVGWAEQNAPQLELRPPWKKVKE